MSRDKVVPCVPGQSRDNGTGQHPPFRGVCPSPVPPVIEPLEKLENGFQTRECVPRSAMPIAVSLGQSPPEVGGASSNRAPRESRRHCGPRPSEGLFQKIYSNGVGGVGLSWPHRRYANLCCQDAAFCGKRGGEGLFRHSAGMTNATRAEALSRDIRTGGRAGGSESPAPRRLTACARLSFHPATLCNCCNPAGDEGL